MHPGEGTRHPDGGTYEPIRVGVVACTFPKTSKAKLGKKVDGRQVELFGADLPADVLAGPGGRHRLLRSSGRGEPLRAGGPRAWPGPDHQLPPARPGAGDPGGLGLWNLRLARGFEMEPPPAERPVPRLRRPLPEDRVPEHWPRDPALRDTLAKRDWSALLAKRPGWCWDAATTELHCEDGWTLTLPASHWFQIHQIY